jgi:hypothetical protein
MYSRIVTPEIGMTTGISEVCHFNRYRGTKRELERVSSTVPQGNPEARNIEEGSVGGEQILLAHRQSAELTGLPRFAGSRRCL